MFRKLFLIVAPVLFFSAIALQICLYAMSMVRSPLITVCMLIWIISSLWMLVMAGIYGSLYKRKWALAAGSILLLLMCAGAFMKLQHWPGSGIMTSISPVLFGLVYCIHFFMKRKYRFVDISKLLFVLLALSTYALVFRQIPSSYEAAVGVSWLLSLVVLFIAVCIQLYKYKAAVIRPEIAQEGNDIFSEK